MKTYSIAVTAAGGAGVATGSAQLPVAPGLLRGMYVQFSGAPATNDTTITETVNSTNRTILTLTNNNTSASHSTAVPAQDATGAAIASQYLPKPVYGGVMTVSIAQSDPGAIVTVVFLVED